MAAPAVGEIWIPSVVARELAEGRERGYDVPDPADFYWLEIHDPVALPSEWLTLDLGPGELSAMALALENPGRVILLDDALARRMAQAAGLQVWGTLKILLDAKGYGLTERVEPHLERLRASGMWISDDVRRRIVALANETQE